MDKEPEIELEPDSEQVLDLVKPPLRPSQMPRPARGPTMGRIASSDQASETATTTETESGDGVVPQILPPNSGSNSPPSRFNTAAPLAPPRRARRPRRVRPGRCKRRGRTRRGRRA